MLTMLTAVIGISSITRVCMAPGNPGKFWIFLSPWKLLEKSWDFELTPEK